MILEIALLQIRPGQTTEFEAAFAQAQPIIAGMPGYVRHELQHCLEDDHRYALLVWRTTPWASAAAPNIKSGAPCCTTSTTRSPPWSTSRGWSWAEPHTGFK